MNKSFLLFAVAVVTATVSPNLIRAQETPLASAPVEVESGYDLFLQAAKLIQPPPKDEVVSNQLAPDEKLRRQRLDVARNAPALAKLREALELNITMPPPRNNDGKFVINFPGATAASDFANQLAQEAAVRAADGQDVAAVQSNLDAMELGVQVGHGMLMNGLVGFSITILSSSALEKDASALDVVQSREVAARLDAMSEQTTKLTEILNAEEAYRGASLRALEAELGDSVKRAQTEADKSKSKKIDTFGNLRFALLEFSSEQIKDALQEVFGEYMARAASPYAKYTREAPVSIKISYVDITNAVIFALQPRFTQERAVVANRLLAAALRLHAAKLETGHYPETFDAGIDPFSPTFAPLVYKRVGDSYVLYSVGPDGKDENGAEIQTLVTDYKTSIKSVSGLLRYDSTGDIVAPVL